MSLERYLELNGKCWKEALELLEGGDMVQTSEKLWGAATEMVKAVAAKRGLSLGTHSSLFQFVAQLSKERPDWDLLSAFHIVESIHTNFYEGWLTEEFVRRGLEAVQDFTKKLKTFL